MEKICKVTGMQSKEVAAQWTKDLSQQIADGINQARGNHSDQWISDRTKELGSPLSRTAISEYRRGIRKSMTVNDLFIIAAALGVPPVTLLFPGLPDKPSTLLPVTNNPTALDALQWVTGERQTIPRGVGNHTAAKEVEPPREYRRELDSQNSYDLHHEYHASAQTNLLYYCRELVKVFRKIQELDRHPYLYFKESLSEKEFQEHLEYRIGLMNQYEKEIKEIEGNIVRLNGTIQSSSERESDGEG